MRKPLYGLTIILMLGCAAQPKNVYSPAYMPRIEWPINEYTTLNNRTGSNTVSGQAFMQDSEIRTAAGKEVFLNPVTSYSTQFVNAQIFQSYGRGVLLTPEQADLRINDYLIKTTADSLGNFMFTNVPDGDYYLYTTVNWLKHYRYMAELQGGFVFKKIRVSSKTQNHHVLTHIDKNNLE